MGGLQRINSTTFLTFGNKNTRWRQTRLFKHRFPTLLVCGTKRLCYPFTQPTKPTPRFAHSQVRAFVPFIFSLSRSLSLSLSRSLSHSLTLSRSLALSLSRSLSHTLALSLSLSLSFFTNTKLYASARVELVIRRYLCPLRRRVPRRRRRRVVVPVPAPDAILVVARLEELRHLVDGRLQALQRVG